MWMFNFFEQLEFNFDQFIEYLLIIQKISRIFILMFLLALFYFIIYSREMDYIKNFVSYSCETDLQYENELYVGNLTY